MDKNKSSQTYIYHCRNEKCDEYFEYKAKGSKLFPDKPKSKCPLCKQKTLDLVLEMPFFYITGNTGVSLGTFAERRRKQIGEAECQEREAKREEREKKYRELMLQKPLPRGMKRMERSTEAPWWRPGTKSADTSLNKLTNEQKMKYIMTGEKPIMNDRALRVI